MSDLQFDQLMIYVRAIWASSAMLTLFAVGAFCVWLIGRAK